MFRKLALTLAASAALGIAPLAMSTSPVEARSAGVHRHHHHHGHHHHWRGHRAYGHAGCVVRRWVATPWGMKLRVVNRCF